MAGKEKIRKRLLYDLSPIPQIPLKREDSGKKLDLEVRVIYKKDTLKEIYNVKGTFAIGSGNGNSVILDEDIFSESSFTLVEKKGDDGVVNIDKGFKGYVVEGEKKTDLSEFGGSSFDITENSFAVIEVGDLSIVVLLTPKGKLRMAPFTQNLDVAASLILLITFTLGVFLVNMLIEVPPIEVDIFEMDNRFADLIIGDEDEEDVEEVEEEKKVKLEKPKEGLKEANTARKSLGEEGKVGDKKSRVANAQGSARRSLDEKVAQSSGIMGALSSGAASFDRVFGGGGLGAGMDRTLGSVTGLSGVDQFGSGGLGTRGFGSGGGGNALGIGGLGTRGRGGGGGTGYGMANGKIGGKGRSAIKVGGGKAVIMGALDRAVIDAYIRRNLAKIRWCYEKELNKDPKIFGKIVINFVIAKTGRVSTSKVKRTTMGNRNVESCVATQIKKIRFPKPKGGGIVIVNYPFVFKNSQTS